MAINSYWFNSVETNGVHDRIYHATSFAEYLNGIVGSGVLAKPSTNLQVTANTGLTVVVKPGSGWINGYKLVLDADMALTLDIAHATLARIDRVVFAVDHEEREMKIYIKKGTAASSPVPPALVDTDELKELSLAQISVPAAATSITQARITDERPSKHCGYISGLIDQVDTATLYDQFLTSMKQFEYSMNSSFLDWFQSLQETLVSNTLFVEKKASYKTDVANLTAVSIPESLQYGAALDVLHVYVNGFRLVEGEEYTKTTGTITFKNPISKTGTLIEITNWKTIGTTNVQEIVDDVITLQDEVSRIKTYNFYTTGTDDETKLNAFINDFFSGTGNFAGTANNQQGVIKVIGKMDITNSSKVTTVSGFSSYIAVSLSDDNTKRLTLDFSDCVINLTITSTTATSIVRTYNSQGRLIIKGLNIAGRISNTNMDLVMTGSDVENATIDVTNTSSNIVTGIKVNTNTVALTNCNVKLTNTGKNTTNVTQIVGIYQTVEETDSYIEPTFQNCHVELIADAGTNYDLYGFSGFGNYDNCIASVKNSGTLDSGATGYYTTGAHSNCYVLARGCKTVKGFDRNGRYVNCKSYTETSCAAGSPTFGFYVYGKLTNCRAVSINGGTGSAYGFFNADVTQKMHMVNCTGAGYVNESAGSTQVAAGFSANGNDTTQTIIMVGCDCPLVARAGRKQTASLRMGGGTTGAKYTLVGNTFFMEPAKHTATGNNYTSIGNIVG